MSAREEIAASAQLACLLEASAPKPGNVSPGTAFRDTQYEHNPANHQKRSGMARAPKQTDECRAENVLVLAHNRRHSNNVVNLSCVF